MAVLLAAAVSGLFGTVVRSPATPVCQAGTPCTAPAADVTLTFTRGGVSHSVVTSSTGRYRIALRPGTYSVRILTRSKVARLTPVTVAVSGVMTRRNFSLDTGIR
jgi:hypothetical protein